MGSCRKGMRGDVWGPKPGRKTDSRGEALREVASHCRHAHRHRIFELLFYHLLMTELGQDPLRFDFLNAGFSRVPFQTSSAGLERWLSG